MKYFTREFIFQESDMLRNSSSKFFKFIMVAIAILLLAGGTMVWAGSLQDLRASGALGESASGYAVARDPSAAAEASSVNAKRKAVYAKKASAQGASVDQVGKVYAGEILKKLPAGTWIQNAAGQWSQK